MHGGSSCRVRLTTLYYEVFFTVVGLALTAVGPAVVFEAAAVDFFIQQSGMFRWSSKEHSFIIHWCRMELNTGPSSDVD